MKAFFTETNHCIPAANITKVFSNGTCSYKVKINCKRCFGTGFFGNYGVCFRCQGERKEIVSAVGYTQEALTNKKSKDEKQARSAQVKANELEEINNKVKKNRKRADKLYTLIKLGGNNSEFASNLASAVMSIVANNYPFKLSQKQMTYVEKFLKIGCELKNQPYEKVLNYLMSFKTEV